MPVWVELLRLLEVGFLDFALPGILLNVQQGVEINPEVQVQVLVQVQVQPGVKLWTRN